MEFSRAARKRITIDRYYDISAHAKIHGKEMTPLEDILAIGSEEKAFSTEAEKAMDARAEQLLREQRAMKNV